MSGGETKGEERKEGEPEEGREMGAYEDGADVMEAMAEEEGQEGVEDEEMVKARGVDGAVPRTVEEKSAGDQR